MALPLLVVAMSVALSIPDSPGAGQEREPERTVVGSDAKSKQTGTERDGRVVTAERPGDGSDATALLLLAAAAAATEIQLPVVGGGPRPITAGMIRGDAGMAVLVLTLPWQGEGAWRPTRVHLDGTDPERSEVKLTRLAVGQLPGTGNELQVIIVISLPPAHGRLRLTLSLSDDDGRTRARLTLTLPKPSS